MKLTLGVLFLLCASAAFGQAAGASALSAQPIVIQMQSHPQHASYMPLGQEQYLAEKSTYTFAQGERPLWEVAPVNSEISLGEVARALREAHLKARKAEFVRED
jgi:hypothetical protein